MVKMGAGVTSMFTFKDRLIGSKREPDSDSD